jgi:hypothetical protein
MRETARMIVLPSLSGRQANGLRHSSQGQHARVRPRNMTSIDRSRPVRALHPLEISQRINHVGELRVNLEPPFLRLNDLQPHYRLGQAKLTYVKLCQVKNIKNFLCSRGLPSLRAIRIKYSKSPSPPKATQGQPSLPKQIPPGGLTSGASAVLCVVLAWRGVQIFLGPSAKPFCPFCPQNSGLRESTQINSSG